MLETKLVYLESIFGSVENAQGINIDKKHKLDSNDLAEVLRAYMTVEVVIDEDKVDWAATSENLVESRDWDNILRPYTMLMSHSGNLYYSSWHSIVQVREPRFASATSLFMLAAKQKHNIPFMYWKRGVPTSEWAFLLHYSTASALSCGVTLQHWNACVPNEALYAQVLRDLTNPLDHNLKQPLNVAEETEDDESPRYHWQEFKTWPKLVRHMKLQTWLFHPSVRDTDAMILHPINWDYVPDPMRATPSINRGPNIPPPVKLNGGFLSKHLAKKNTMLDALRKK